MKKTYLFNMIGCECCQQQVQGSNDDEDPSLLFLSLLLKATDSAASLSLTLSPSEPTKIYYLSTRSNHGN